MNFIKLLIVLGFKANNQVIPNTRVVVYSCLMFIITLEVLRDFIICKIVLTPRE